MVTVSSTTRQRAPGSAAPSTQRCSPCCLRSPRTKKPSRSSPAGHREGRAGRAGSRPSPGRRRRSPRLGRRRGDQLAGGEKAGGPQQRPARVDVVLRRRAAGERHLADHQRVLAQLGEQGLLGGVEIGHGEHPMSRASRARSLPARRRVGEALAPARVARLPAELALGLGVGGAAQLGRRARPPRRRRPAAPARPGRACGFFAPTASAKTGTHSRIGAGSSSTTL